MPEVLVIAIEGLTEAALATDELQKDVDLAVRRAINKTIDRTRTRLARMVTGEVNLPASYVSPSSGRLAVFQRAKPGNLEAVIRGRDTPTSLARFAGQQKRPKVRVKRSAQARYIARSFIINLRGGNRGLALRTDGEAPRNAYKPKEIGKNLWLLYGPSVDQILMGASNNGGAFAETESWAAEQLEAEFWRLMKVEID